MNPTQYKAFYDKVGKTNGWDFSSVKCVSEGAKWDFFEEVAKRCRQSDLLLDIGTGGGEAALPVADSVLLLIGIDQSAGMIDTAVQNGAKASKNNTRFLQMNAEKLDFPRSFFNIVSCRHSEFFADQVAKVLPKGGIFLTQQVSENDKLNLKEAFGKGQEAGKDAGTLKRRYMAELSDAGFTDIQSFDYDAAEYYESAEDLIFLLKHTPIIPDFGQSDNDFQILQQFIADHKTEKGIRTNSERFMIIARL